MKTKMLVLASLMFIMPSVSVAEEVTVTVKGMVCSFCAQGLKKTFGKKENVKGIEVDLDKKVVKVETSEGKPLSDEEIKSTINDAGFDVVNIERGKSA